MPDDARGQPGDPGAATGFGRHVAVFFEDPALWPILLILIVHVALGGAVVLLAALRGGSLPGMAALAVLLTLSGDLIRRARQRRRVAFWVVTLWALSALVAASGARLGLL